MKIISLPKKIGEQLGHRNEAAELREEILRLEHPVQLDFSGVKVISYSFAEEFFGHLTKTFGPDIFDKKISLKNLRPEHRSIIQAAVRRAVESKSNKSKIA
jgi:hypothetical protein